jgi:hypothetical protein
VVVLQERKQNCFGLSRDNKLAWKEQQLQKWVRFTFILIAHFSISNWSENNWHRGKRIPFRGNVSFVRSETHFIVAIGIAETVTMLHTPKLSLCCGEPEISGKNWVVITGECL